MKLSFVERMKNELLSQLKLQLWNFSSLRIPANCYRLNYLKFILQKIWNNNIINN